MGLPVKTGGGMGMCILGSFPCGAGRRTGHPYGMHPDEWPSVYQMRPPPVNPVALELEDSLG